MGVEEAKERRAHLHTWMWNLGVKKRLTLDIKRDAEYGGKPIYDFGSTLAMCRNDLIQLEKEGKVERDQYLTSPIKWSVV